MLLSVWTDPFTMWMTKSTGKYTLALFPTSSCEGMIDAFTRPNTLLCRPFKRTTASVNPTTFKAGLVKCDQGQIEQKVLSFYKKLHWQIMSGEANAPKMHGIIHQKVQDLIAQEL